MSKVSAINGPTENGSSISIGKDVSVFHKAENVTTSVVGSLLCPVFTLHEKFKGSSKACGEASTEC